MAACEQRLAVGSYVLRQLRQRLRNEEVSLEERPQRAMAKQHLHGAQQFAHAGASASDLGFPIRRARIELPFQTLRECLAPLEAELEFQQFPQMQRFPVKLGEGFVVLGSDREQS